MPTLRFEGPFHQSDLNHFLQCPRSFYYGRVIGLGREKTQMGTLAGIAGHEVIRLAHETGEWSAEFLAKVFRENLEVEIQKAQEKDQKIEGRIDEEKYLTMLNEYARRPWNREAKVILSEAPFTFEIKPHRTAYQFAGRIDQVVEVETALLQANFPRQFENIDSETVILHRDLKFGQRRDCTDFGLLLNKQFDVYALALAQNDWAGQINLAYVAVSDPLATLAFHPHFHIKYHLQDHIPYKDDKGAFLKDEAGNNVPCDIVPAPCLVGKKQEPCSGKRSYCTKQSRGPGMYFTTRPPESFPRIIEELGRVCTAIRRGAFPRSGPNELCVNYCGHREVCEAELKIEYAQG